MKVAIFVNTFPCRSETFITNQVAGLIARGHQVSVYAERGDLDFQSIPELRRLGWRPFYFQQGPNRIPENKFLRVLKGFPLILEGHKQGNVSLLNALNVRRFGRLAASCELLYKVQC